MKTEVPDIDSFLEDEFSLSGMRNLYGKDRLEPDFQHTKESRAKQELRMHKNINKLECPKVEDEIEIVGCQITTHFYNNNIYYVLVGYERGCGFADGTRAQGRSFLRIYKMKPEEEEGDTLETPDELLLYTILNDKEFDYANYKNYIPVLKHGLSIYYHKIRYDKIKKLTDLTLWKYSIDRENEDRVKLKGTLCNFIIKDTEYPGMHVTHVAWITNYPQLEVGPN